MEEAATGSPLAGCCKVKLYGSFRRIQEAGQVAAEAVEGSSSGSGSGNGGSGVNGGSGGVGQPSHGTT